ncbi:MAG: NUDIX domain-containing protein [Patescibacteria group bacterium]|nr:NUDIX domain-containing protein [Patescibacteria group bacterium]
MNNASKELFVQVDSGNNIVGPIEKNICHAQGILHRTVSILVFDTQGDLLMQLRSKEKDLYPGLYTLSATGHVDWTTNGPETYEQAAQREYEEELGKKPANPLVAKFTAEFDAPGHHTMPTVYYTTDEGPFNPNLKEVQKVEFLPLEKVKEIADRITPPSRMVLDRLGLIQ